MPPSRVVGKPHPLTATSRDPRAISRLARSALHLAYRQAPSSRKLKAIIGRLEGFAWGVLADKEFGEQVSGTSG